MRSWQLRRSHQEGESSRGNVMEVERGELCSCRLERKSGGRQERSAALDHVHYNTYALVL